jgi:hypothetical protein
VDKSKPRGTPKPTLANPATPKPAKANAIQTLGAIQAATCKISADFQVKAAGMPVTINLCSDAKGTPAPPDVVLVSVDVYDSSGKPVNGQPTSLKSNSFVLNLKQGAFDINSTIGPGPGATPNAKPTVFLYEACNKSTTQLCAFIAGGPGCGFSLTVI